MAVVPAAERVATLREWGISDPLIRLSCGESPHPQLDYFSYGGPPGYIYDRESGVRPPRGSLFAPLWELNETVTGVWLRKKSLEFIKFEFARPSEYTVLAHTEQGFWATIFDFLYEMDTSVKELRVLAKLVGFQFLNRILSAYKETASGTYGDRRTRMRSVVADIDQESPPR